MAQDDITFGFTIAPVDAPGTDDDRLYEICVQDAKFGHRLGYEVAYMVEHHFSDYFPIPNPLMLFMHLAPQCPGLGFGTMVLVTPWHQPLRLAEEIAMLSVVCDAPLHLGLGRGNAPLEYNAFDVPMEETQERFAEAWHILDLALTGEPFTYRGKYLSVPREVRIRPHPHRERITFYGAIGNPESAERIADLGLAPMSNGFLPFDLQKQIMARWDARTRARGGSTKVGRPVVVSCVMADTDEEARVLAREYLPRFFRLAAKHYEVDHDPYKNIKGYEAFSKLFAGLTRFSDPANLDPYIDVTFVGGAETVIRQVQNYIDCGFNNFMVMASSPGIPQGLRQEWLERFAKDVAPHFSAKFGKAKKPRLAAAGE
jgi:alkanesulfonate monooxygenase SsuD/methylene tetrahydromethanopterin reductase-like flavin-dependent oxidoreductase (luciferase family)